MTLDCRLRVIIFVMREIKNSISNRVNLERFISLSMIFSFLIFFSCSRPANIGVRESAYPTRGPFNRDTLISIDDIGGTAINEYCILYQLNSSGEHIGIHYIRDSLNQENAVGAFDIQVDTNETLFSGVVWDFPNEVDSCNCDFGIGVFSVIEIDEFTHTLGILKRFYYYDSCNRKIIEYDADKIRTEYDNFYWSP